jgi:DNA-binding MarR family transcriptional regulator
MARLASYVKEALDLEVRLRPCSERPLPLYLTSEFEFACGNILELDCVFLGPRASKVPSASVLEKRLTRAEEVFGRPGVLVFETLSSKDRARLVARRLPFIVPFAQLYLPPLGIDFREKVRPRIGAGDISKVREVFAPTTQLVLLYVLHRAAPGDLQAGALAEALSVSSMSVSRALRDLEAYGLITRWQEGRRRPARLARAKRETWKKAQPLVVSPVKARILTHEQQIPGSLEAGLTALARVSNLAPPRERTVALSSEAWQELQDHLRWEPLTNGGEEPGQMRVEVWTYAPKALSTGPTVDVLSLYLTLRDEKDERVEVALEDAMKVLQW